MSYVKHGERPKGGRTPEYLSWSKMRDRCLNTKHHAYARYGGRGITVCSRWNEYANFLVDMGRKPSPSHSLDRIDNNQGYSPANCRWASKKEQGRNRADNKLVQFRGKTQSVAAWADELNIPRTALYQRLGHGMAVEDALTKPLRGRG